MITKITDHIERGWARLTSRFIDRPRVRALVAALVIEAQTLEDAIFAVFDNVRNLDSTNPAALDRMAALLGAPGQSTRTIAQWQGRIRAQVAANRSSGQSSDAYAAARALVLAWSPAGAVRVNDDPPACFVVEGQPANLANEDSEARELAALLNDVAAAGVRSVVVSKPLPAANRFTYDVVGQGYDAGGYIGTYDR